MRERRWPWMVAAVLLAAAAVVAAWSTYLHWLPCRGTLLSGSLVRGFRYGPDFSDECLRRMDAGLPFPFPPDPSEQTPWSAELSVVAMVLAGTAWLILVAGMRWALHTKVVAILPGLATLSLAAASAVAAGDTARSPYDSMSGWFGVAPEAAALVAVAAIWHWQPEVQGRCFARVLVVAWGTTAFGSVHMVVEYVLMIFFSAANWDVPPLTGSVTVLTLLASAVLSLTLAIRWSPLRKRGKEKLSHADQAQQYEPSDDQGFMR